MTALSESFYLMSIHNVFSWPISTLLLFSQIGKPILDRLFQCVLMGVKNRFSDLTNEQEGRDQPRKDVMNRCQVKALREGCCERKEAQMGVSSREKMNTNRNLARATTKSKSKMQTVSNGHVG